MGLVLVPCLHLVTFEPEHESLVFSAICVQVAHPLCLLPCEVGCGGGQEAKACTAHLAPLLCVRGRLPHFARGR